MIKLNYTLLQKTCNILSSGGNVTKKNCTFRIDVIKVISLMQHLQEEIQLKAGRLRNVTIAGHNLNLYLCMRSVERH